MKMGWVAIGVKCVCVNGNWGRFCRGELELPTVVPAEGEIFTITGVNPEGSFLGLAFEEIPLFQSTSNPNAFLCGNCWWDAEHFRPLATLESDVEKFKHLLVPVRKLENV